MQKVHAMKAIDLRDAKNNILRTLLTRPSLQIHEINENKVDVLTCLGSIEQDGHIRVIKDMQGLPIHIRLTDKGRNFILLGGYKHPVFEFMSQFKGIIGSISDLIGKFTGASIIVLAIYIMQ